MLCRRWFLARSCSRQGGLAAHEHNGKQPLQNTMPRDPNISSYRPIAAATIANNILDMPAAKKSPWQLGQRNGLLQASGPRTEERGSMEVHIHCMRRQCTSRSSTNADSLAAGNARKATSTWIKLLYLTTTPERLNQN